MSSEEFSQRDVLTALQEYVVEVDGEPRVQVDIGGKRRTVEVREVFEFERDILDRLIAPQVDNSVTGAAVPIKGEWVHGWLALKGQDFINHIWKNYQVFLKYVEARTSVIGNIGTFQRAPGTYDSMYRYLIILEELDLLERFRTEEVPPEEYDFPVPEEFRQRTYIRLTDEGIAFQDNKDVWNNPYEALYPGGEKPEEQEDEGEEIPVEPTENIPEELTGFQPEAQPEPEVPEPEPQPDAEPESEEESESGSAEGLGAFTGEPEEELPEELPGEFELPEQNASFVDFPEKESIITLVEQSFPEALNRGFEIMSTDELNIEPEDFSLGRIAVFGEWAVGNAVPGQTPLKLMVSIDSSNAENRPRFVTASIDDLEDVMAENNPYPDIFPSYTTVGVFNSVFLTRLKANVRTEGGQSVYYSLQDMELKELE